MRLTIALAGALAITASGTLCAQGGRGVTIRTNVLDEDRPVLGITTGYGGARDTLGVLVASVTPGGPADKAGIEEGNRLASINGVNLRLDPADAGEREMSGVLTRRLTRELAKVKAGDEVTLRVWADGKYRDVKVKPIAAEDLPGNESFFRTTARNRAALGLSLSASGSRRDTLGLMVVRVTTDGPAEKAGIIEGERITAINNVDLRVSSEDAGDSWAANARMNRFRREIAKLRPDDEVELKVWSGGRTRTVKVKAIRPSDMPRESGASFFFSDGLGGFQTMVAPMTPPQPPMPAIAPRARILRLDDGDMRLQIEPRIELDLRNRADEARARADEIRARTQAMTRARTEEIRARTEALTREIQERSREMSNQLQRQLRDRLFDLRWRLENELDDSDGEIVRQPATPTPRAERALPSAPAIAPATPAPAQKARGTMVRMTVTM